MTVNGREALERELEALHARGDFESAAKLALEGYGAEILGLVFAVLRDRDAAAEVYAEFSANLWAALPQFRWQSSFRTWAYTLARNAAFRHLRDPLRRRGVSIDDCPAIEDVPASSRTATATFRKTEAKENISALRRSLDPDDQMLLVLRVDRGLAWDEIAQVMSPEESLSGEGFLKARKRAAAALRKRFERLKGEIRALVTANHAAAL